MLGRVSCTNERNIKVRENGDGDEKKKKSLKFPLTNQNGNQCKRKKMLRE